MCSCFEIIQKSERCLCPMLEVVTVVNNVYQILQQFSSLGSFIIICTEWLEARSESQAYFATKRIFRDDYNHLHHFLGRNTTLRLPCASPSLTDTAFSQYFCQITFEVKLTFRQFFYLSQWVFSWRELLDYPLKLQYASTQVLIWHANITCVVIVALYSQEIWPV